MAPRKGGVSQRGFLKSSASRLRKKRMINDIGSSSTVGTQSATAKRGVHLYKTPLARTPFPGSGLWQVDVFRPCWNPRLGVLRPDSCSFVGGYAGGSAPPNCCSIHFFDADYVWWIC